MIGQGTARSRSRLALAAGLALVGLALGAEATSAQTPSETRCVRHLGGPTVVIAAGTTETCDVLAINTDVVVDETATVEGDVVVLGGDAIIRGTVNGDVNVSFGTLEVNGKVTGAAYASDALTLTSRAEVGRTAVTLGKTIADPAARVGTRSAGATAFMPRRWLGVLAIILSAALFAGLAATVAPSSVARLSATTQRGGILSFFVGAVLSLALIPMAALTLTQVPIWPLWLIVGLVWLAATALGGLGLSERLGSRLVPRASRPAQTAAGAAVFMAAPAILGSAGPIGVCLGALAIFVPLFTSTGAGLLSVFGARAWPQGQEMAEQPGSPPSAFDLPPAPAAAPAPLPTEVTWPGQRPSDSPPSDSPAPSTGHLSPPPIIDAAEDEPGTNLLLPEDDAAEFAPLPAAEVETELEPPHDELPRIEPPLEAAPSPAEGTAVSGETVAAAGPTAASPSPDPAQGDLGQLPAITPIFAHLLGEAGINSIGGLAAASPSQVVDALSRPGVTPVSEATAAAWIASARELLGA